ncbi:MAG: glycosyltransferase family 9 protein [Verrucomicrobiae bacterium]|nr:glycosyltransferase family 9 protein [Verrucomicrobiae bacterium]
MLLNECFAIQSGANDMYKKAAKQLFPAAAYERAAVHWRKFRGFREQQVWNLKMSVQHGLPDVLVYFGIAPGDDMLCTAVLHELKQRGQKKIWMMSKNPGLFEENADVDRVVPIEDRYRVYVQTFGKKWQPLEYARFDPEKDRSEPPKRHIIAELCWRAGVRGTVKLHPRFHVQAGERAKAAWAAGHVAIQSSGLGGQWPMRNKQWYPERFQQVVAGLKGKFKFVQLGSANDPLLNDVIDLRGKTNLRESAAVIENCRLYLGNPGFLMHLARAVERPSVIVYGGREAPWQSGYSCNLNLYSAVPCAPCWLWNKCDHDRLCMEKITADDVIQAVEQMTSKAPQPLVVDEATV